MKTKGLTLVEVMIIVVIIGLLMAMAIPTFQKIHATTLVKAYERGDKLTKEEMVIVREELKNTSKNPTPVQTSNESRVVIPASEVEEVVVKGEKFYIWIKK